MQLILLFLCVSILFGGFSVSFLQRAAAFYEMGAMLIKKERETLLHECFLRYACALYRSDRDLQELVRIKKVVSRSCTVKLGGGDCVVELRYRVIVNHIEIEATFASDTFFAILKEK